MKALFSRDEALYYKVTVAVGLFALAVALLGLYLGFNFIIIGYSFFAFFECLGFLGFMILFIVNNNIEDRRKMNNEQ